MVHGDCQQGVILQSYIDLSTWDENYGVVNSNLFEMEVLHGIVA